MPHSDLCASPLSSRKGPEIGYNPTTCSSRRPRPLFSSYPAPRRFNCPSRWTPTPRPRPARRLAPTRTRPGRRCPRRRRRRRAALSTCRIIWVDRPAMTTLMSSSTTRSSNPTVSPARARATRTRTAGRASTSDSWIAETRTRPATVTCSDNHGAA
ncbi:hypothetical protein F4802DRAFT_326911 [Xylaria palmicola]|nr:hypothetical protein F4802DRAFT_326911 [Xylaria palmicola]